MQIFNPIKDIRALRTSLGLNQTEFWAQIGVNQPSGSRYEAGHSYIPKTVYALLHLVYIKGLDSKIIKFNQIKDIRTLRKKRRFTQAEFWAQVGMTQSAGSIYESGSREMTKPVCALLHLIHIKGLNVETMKFSKKVKNFV